MQINCENIFNINFKHILGVGFYLVLPIVFTSDAKYNLLNLGSLVFFKIDILGVFCGFVYFLSFAALSILFLLCKSIDFLLEKRRSKFLPISIVADTARPCYIVCSILFLCFTLLAFYILCQSISNEHWFFTIIYFILLFCYEFMFIVFCKRQKPSLKQKIFAVFVGILIACLGSSGVFNSYTESEFYVKKLINHGLYKDNSIVGFNNNYGLYFTKLKNINTIDNGYLDSDTQKYIFDKVYLYFKSNVVDACILKGDKLVFQRNIPVNEVHVIDANKTENINMDIYRRLADL